LTMSSGIADLPVCRRRAAARTERRTVAWG
jgi:hypothetical protein